MSLPMQCHYQQEKERQKTKHTKAKNVKKCRENSFYTFLYALFLIINNKTLLQYILII
jgi:hypothetical protein